MTLIFCCETVSSLLSACVGLAFRAIDGEQAVFLSHIFLERAILTGVAEVLIVITKKSRNYRETRNYEYFSKIEQINDT